MEDGYTQLGTVLIDQRPEDSDGDGVIVVGRFKGDPYDGVQLSYEAGRRNLYLTPEGALPGIPARGGSRRGYRHPVGITGSRWLTTEIRLRWPHLRPAGYRAGNSARGAEHCVDSGQWNVCRNL
jgi:hypothetical protein